MSVQRMLDLRPLRPPCPHTPPPRRPRGDEGPARWAACSPSSLAAGGSDSRTGSELAVQLSSELCVSVVPVQGSRLPGDERVGGMEDRNLAFRPLSDGPALVLSTARGGAMTAGVSPSLYPEDPSLQHSGSCRCLPCIQVLLGAFLGIRACGLRAKMPEGMDAPG